MRTPLMPAAVEMSPKAADRSRTERIDELAESPWSGVLSVTAPDDTLVAACSALGAARLIDLSGARLGVGDDMPAIAAGMVLIQTVVEGALDFAAGGEGHAALRPGHVVIRAAAVDAFLAPYVGLAERSAGAGAAIRAAKSIVAGADDIGAVSAGLDRERAVFGTLWASADNKAQVQRTLDKLQKK